GRPAVDHFIVTVGNRHVHACVAVGSRAEDDIVLGNTQTPGVIVAGADEFEFGTIWLKTINALPEANLLPPHRAGKSRVTDRAPNPVIKSVAQIARSGMGVPSAPASEKRLAQIRLIIPVGIFEK